MIGLKNIFWVMFLPILLILWSVDPAAAADNAVERAKPAQKKEKKKDKESKPLNITADRMEADDIKKIIIFTGNVIARQDDVVMNCDLMRVYYQKTPGSPSKPGQTPGKVDSKAGADSEGKKEKGHEIFRVYLEGNVKITRGDQVAMGKKGEYLAKHKPRVFILTGKPRVWRNKDVLTGKRITVYLDEDRSVVEGGRTQRVNATFYEKPKAEPGKASTKPSKKAQGDKD